MTINIRAINFPITEAIHEWARARVTSALRPFEDSVQRVFVRLQDINSPNRGGVDKRCSIVIAIRGHGGVVTESVDQDLYRAIDDAAARVRRTVARIARRRRTQERADVQRPGALLIT